MRVANRQHKRLGLRLCALRTGMRTPRLIGQQLISGSKTTKPLVPSLRTDPKPPTQLTAVSPFLHRKPNKLSSLLHDRHLLPRHGWPPSKPIPCNDDVST